MLISLILMLIVVIPVIIISFVFAYRYRESNTANYQPDWAHSVKLEIIWWGIPCIIIAILAWITFKTSHSLDPFKPISEKKPMIIQVLALQWKWLFIYPEQNIATVNYVQFPANVPVKFEITSKVSHEFFSDSRIGRTNLCHGRHENTITFASG